MQTNHVKTSPQILYLDEIRPEDAGRAGGKAAKLAQLKQHGFPVPDAFVIPSEAFIQLEETGNLETALASALAQLSGGAHNARYAVRSSAVDEDSGGASFAGEFETRLEVPADKVAAAARDVYASRLSERAAAYARARDLAGSRGMNILVQVMIPAEIAGVLFTADPLTGGRTALVGNYVAGLGEKLVSGEADPGAFRLLRPKGRFAIDRPGPADGAVRKIGAALYRTALAIETLFEGPQDIEWAAAAGRLFILQARPITTMSGTDPQAGGPNDSLLGDFLWTSTNFGEALPDVMTPITRSMMMRYMAVNRIGIEENGFPMGGSIGGRLYMNLTLPATLFRALGFSAERIHAMVADAFGELPEGVDIPIIPTGRWTAIRSFVPHAFRRARLVNKLKAGIPDFIRTSPGEAEDLTKAIQAAGDAAALHALWTERIAPMVDHTMLMLAAGTSDYKKWSRGLRADLNRLVGEGDANALLSGRPGAGEIASLGPVLGLARLARGEISRAEYIRAYGHRGPSEFELSQAAPAETPEGLDDQLASARANTIDPRSLLERKQAQHAEAWGRLITAHPKEAAKLDKRLAALHAASHTREAVRSEVVRRLRVLRPYALRAGALSGLGENIFYLELDEIAAVLLGDLGPAAVIPERKARHARFSALPNYPALIRGRFLPLDWAADPERRLDIYLNGATAPPQAEDLDAHIRGFAGSPGVVEGRVRVLAALSESAAFENDEILVAHTTNIGWTPIFPRAAAIITDVGAPLSHAAIVARELGIPAVVGTGTATARLKTGDRVRVDGGGGLVTRIGDV